MHGPGGPGVLAGPVTTVRVDRVDLDSTARAGRVAPALGTAMTIAAISTELRGVTDQRLGAGEPPRPAWDRPLPPPGAPWNYGPINYWGYQETPYWNPSSTSSGSTSSEFGSRCKNSPHQTPASPIGGAGVALSPVGELSAE